VEGGAGRSRRRASLMRTWGSLALQRARDNIGACPAPYAHAGGIGDAPGTACSPGPRRNFPAPTGSCAWCGAGARELRRGGAGWRGRRGVECARGWLADSDPQTTCGGMGRLPMRGARHWCPFDAPHAACTRKQAHLVIHTPPQHGPAAAPFPVPPPRAPPPVAAARHSRWRCTTRPGNRRRPRPGRQGAALPSFMFGGSLAAESDRQVW
jgi:hypothetical protein